MTAETTHRWHSVFTMILLTLISEHAIAQDGPKIGIPTRVPWTTSRISGSPEPPLPYVTEPVFAALKFDRCLDITTAPGSDRLFVVEQSGKIFSFPERPDVAAADLVVDLAAHNPEVKQVYALAFHPDFENNRYCYVCYIKAADLADGTHVARFQMADTDPPTIDASTETTLITWLSGGHNGCCLKFGPDGFLYISTGDGGPANPPDIHRTGQDVSDLLSSVLRIDVDHNDNGKNYRIPPDNPFLGQDEARGEIWAYGLRNPWRMSFDSKTGDLWVGDVGWELWEMLYRVERGGNYGWAVMEGRASNKPEWPRGPTPVLPPIIDHPHSESSSITDGLTYYGTRLPELTGTHIYGDYDTGKLWGFRVEDGSVVDHRELADTTHRIVGFGEDYDGELILLDHTAGTLHRLIPNPQPDRSQTFPRTLSATGLFESTDKLIPAPGVIPYSINAEPWADHAVAERLVAVQDDSAIRISRAAWSFPNDSVLVKTLSLDMSEGDSATRRRIETQILHFDGLDWMPYTYQWNDSQTDAELVDAGGAEHTFEIMDPEATGGTRRQTWRFAGRAECQRCHNKWSGPPLAFNAPQLNKEHDYGDVTTSQLDTVAHIKLIDSPIAADDRVVLADPQDASADLTDRARAYLHTNCAHCHRLHAGGAVLSHMPFDLPLEKTNMPGARPSQGTFGIYAAEVIAPGDPWRSVLLYRMSKLGSGRMPHIGSTEVDRAGVDLIFNWVQQLPPESNPSIAGDSSAAQLRAAERAKLQRLSQAEAAPRQREFVAELLSSTTGAMVLLRAVENHEIPDSAVSLTIDIAARHSSASVRDLFERFLPADQRVRRLGSVVRPEQILSLTGDAGRGRHLFFETAGVSCRNCHRVGKEGAAVGPELTVIAKKLNPAQLLESILEPSKRIDPKYVSYLVETSRGRLFSGLLIERNDQEVILRESVDKLHRIPAESVEELVPQRQSLMPDLLVRDMTAQQLADLLAYLGSLK